VPAFGRSLPLSVAGEKMRPVRNPTARRVLATRTPFVAVTRPKSGRVAADGEPGGAKWRGRGGRRPPGSTGWPFSVENEAGERSGMARQPLRRRAVSPEQMAARPQQSLHFSERARPLRAAEAPVLYLAVPIPITSSLLKPVRRRRVTRSTGHRARQLCARGSAASDTRRRHPC
jgi:hypothetical protein